MPSVKILYSKIGNLYSFLSLLPSPFPACLCLTSGPRITWMRLVVCKTQFFLLFLVKLHTANFIDKSGFVTLPAFWCGHTKARDKPEKIIPDRARPKNGWFYQRFAGNFKKVVPMMPDSTRISLCLKKRQNLVLSGTIWPTSLKFPTNFWCRKPDRTSHFLVLLRLGRFYLVCLALV